MIRIAKFNLLAAAGLALLSACGERELIIEGERRDVSAEGAAAVKAVPEGARPLSVPPPVANAAWTHPGGGPTHMIGHPALGRELAPVWSAEIGAGEDRRHRIAADPVVADGRVFTLDSRARVSAFSTSGAALWSRDLTPPGDRSDDVSGGGLAAAGGTLFVTSGFGMLVALDAATGETLWEQDLDAAATGAPLADGGRVYVVTGNAIGWAIDAENGRILWQVLGAPSESGILGGTGPVLAGQLVVFPFDSGQLVAAVANVGSPAWLASVAGRRPGRAWARVSDLTGEPLFDGRRLYAGNHAGRVAAFDVATGREVWSTGEGALGPMWRAGDSLFLISDENRLLRLDAETGATIWARELPYYTRQRLSRRKAIFGHYGPVLAGGRLIVVSDDRTIREFAPEDGRLLAETPLPSGAARNPVVAGGTLYVVTENGRLHAFR